MAAVLQQPVVRDFVCLGADCEDTCCRHWSMQVDAETKSHYDQNELKESVVYDDVAKSFVMRRDADGHCVKLEGGWCGVYKAFGPALLGDACFFYPRVTRRLGESTLMSATMSCPEIARLALFTDNDFMPAPAEKDRVPREIRDYLPAALEGADALGMHRGMTERALDPALPPEVVLTRLSTIARQLDRLPPAQWPEQSLRLWEEADRLAAPPVFVPEDPFNLLHALCGLSAASGNAPAPRLAAVITSLEHSLYTRVGWQPATITTSERSWEGYQAMHRYWYAHCAAPMAEPLKRWLAMQMSMKLFPFAGVGANLSERVTVLGVHFATVRLALMSKAQELQRMLLKEEIVACIQPLARLMDHLTDAEFIFRVYGAAGWMDEGRLRGIIENRL